ncbi:hypothetical protein A2U01_0012973, partial [Trifolium medium]|nr:hypothetical protein [Trifolium medium]
NSLKEIARKEAPRKPHFLRKPFYSGGNDLYYITMKGITVVDVDKEITVGEEYPLPPVEMMWYDPILFRFQMGDHLSCIGRKSVHDDHKTYKIYILDFDSRKWTLYHEMEPFDFAVTCGHETIILLVVHLWINDQIVFQVFIKKKGDIYTGLRSIHFSYNVKTRQLKKVEDIEEGKIGVWLHTNSLVSLPGAST